MPTSREYPKYPLVGVGALIVKGSKVLLVKRGRPPHRGLWSVPGGLVEMGEGTKEALRREVYEELGMKGTVGELFDVLTTVERDESGNPGFHFVILDYIVTTVGREVRANEESEAFGWFTAKQARSLPMTPGTKRIVIRCLGSRVHA